MKIQNEKNVAYVGDHVIENQVSRVSKPFETRPDWAVAYPDFKRQNAFCGVTRLAENGERFWLNVQQDQDCFDLQLKAKDDPGAKPYRCRLHASHQNQFAGLLQLSGTAYRVSLRQDAGCLRVHFELERGEP